MSAIPCLLWASGGAACSVAASTCVAYPAFVQAKRGGQYSRRQRTLHAAGNIVLSLASVGCFVLATGYGPVALAMPLQTGASLLLNMWVQTLLRMKRYSKEMTSGTLVLVCAVVILVDVGPREQGSDPIPLLQTRPAIAWNCLTLVLCLLGARGIRTTQAGSMAQLGAYSLAISSTTVLGASIGKIMQEATGGVVYFFAALYLASGVLIMYWSTAADTVTDRSLLMPVKSSLALALNCITGLLVWQDWRVIEAWASYTMVYLLILLGVYTCAQDVDIVSSLSLRNHIKGAMLSAGVASSSFGRSVKDLVDIWEKDPQDLQRQALPAMDCVLRKGMRGGAIKPETVRKLTMRLFGELGAGPSGALLTWIKTDWPYFQEYARHDPEFHEKILTLARRAGVDLTNMSDAVPEEEMRLL
jgi:hypothetical protein